MRERNVAKEKRYEGERGLVINWDLVIIWVPAIGEKKKKEAEGRDLGGRRRVVAMEVHRVDRVRTNLAVASCNQHPFLILFYF
ncbi:hypothetical protein Csa_021066 [Cucumis sativus]|uniref:Uncharacterized protein n=1 Tax=Cucumis sativus TaxID=3659 RepID=A0A0A0KF40_CUCSA|nr:hypothetical protein Csa_021066 [Cucumis sativus]